MLLLMSNRSIASTQPEFGLCELCGASSAHDLFSTRDRLATSERTFSIASCDGCGVWRTLPPMDENELAAFYPGDYWGDEENTSADWIRSSQAEKTTFLKKVGLTGGRILDVGCGSGYFLRSLDSGKWERFGVENGKSAAESASRGLGKDRIFSGTLVEAGFQDFFFDVVAFWSVLEHTNEPRKNLVEARRILRPGGLLIIQVPNAASYQTRWFGGQWFALDAPRHRYHFSMKTLDRLLSEIGFRMDHKTYWSKVHNVHALRQSLKTTLRARESRLRFALFCLAIPFLKPIDGIMTLMEDGATLTLAARRT